MNTLLWIIQVLLSLVFLATGIMKLVRTKEQLVTQMGALEALSVTQIRMLGLAEVAGSMGLILPSLTGIMPWLTSLAALGLALTMLGASVAHLQRKEYKMLVMTLVNLFLLVLVAVGRLWISPL